jgi:hypothetical protein
VAPVDRHPWSCTPWGLCSCLRGHKGLECLPSHQQSVGTRVGWQAQMWCEQTQAPYLWGCHRSSCWVAASHLPQVGLGHPLSS